MRILFAGTPALAVPSLQKATHACEVAAVLTSPDRPSGRGRSPVPSPVKAAALSLGIPVLTPERLDAAVLEHVRALLPDLLVVAAYGKIFRQLFLDMFPMGGINLHPSLLPRYRGPSPVSAAILNGDPETGVTIQRMALKFDTGDILAQERHPLRGNETTATLTDALSVQGAEMLGRVLSKLAAGHPPIAVVQNDDDASYCRILNKEDGIVSWDEPAAVLERKIRAFSPWPKAATLLSGETLLLLKSHLYPDSLCTDMAPGVPGDVLKGDTQHGLLVATGNGILALERLQLQFKKPLDWRAFLNGNPGIIKTRLGV